jgi:hypothetical protein
MRRPHATPVLALVALTACAEDTRPTAAPATPVPAADASAAAGTITAEDLRARIGLLAADSMRGRDTPSPELDQVADWIASEFLRLGLRPGADGDFIQRYPVRSAAFDAAGSTARLGDEGTLAWGEDILPAASLPPAGSWSGSLVVVTGAGPLPRPAEAVRDRHVLVLGRPESERPGAWMAALADAGAAAVWTVDTRDDAAWNARAQRALAPRTVRPPAADATPSVTVRENALRSVLSGAGLDADALLGGGDGPLTLEALDVPVTLTLVLRDVQDVAAPNVIGILEGSDPDLRDEYVLYSAHMDHVGVGSPDATGDSIYNGADDDASGTATVIEVAEAMASLPRAPRRSMAFLLVSGEEKGLWGSAHFADNPTVPLERVVANLNADMVGRNWPDTIVAIGREHSDLGSTLERVNADHPELGMTAIDDLWPEQNFYGRSDHFNFARKGVPILFFFNGTHEDYHRPSDEVEAIDADKTARIGQLLFYLGIEVADADARPEWDPESYREIVERN